MTNTVTPPPPLQSHTLHIQDPPPPTHLQLLLLCMTDLPSVTPLCMTDPLAVVTPPPYDRPPFSYTPSLWQTPLQLHPLPMADPPSVTPPPYDRSPFSYTPSIWQTPLQLHPLPMADPPSVTPPPYGRPPFSYTPSIWQTPLQLHSLPMADPPSVTLPPYGRPPFSYTPSIWQTHLQLHSLHMTDPPSVTLPPYDRPPFSYTPSLWQTPLQLHPLHWQKGGWQQRHRPTACTCWWWTLKTLIPLTNCYQLKHSRTEPFDVHGSPGPLQRTDPDLALALQKRREDNSILSIAVNVHNRRIDHVLSANQAKHIPVYGGVDSFSIQPFFTMILLQMQPPYVTHCVDTRKKH